MRMDKLTNQLQSALADAQSLALGKDHNYIEPVHLLSALLEQQGGSARPLLQKAGANLNTLRAEVAAKLLFCTIFKLLFCTNSKLLFCTNKLLFSTKSNLLFCTNSKLVF